jgi:hypothetical protein
MASRSVSVGARREQGVEEGQMGVTNVLFGQ